MRPTGRQHRPGARAHISDAACHLVCDHGVHAVSLLANGAVGQGATAAAAAGFAQDVARAGS